VKEVKAGQGVVFAKQPNNPYDPAAVAVETAAGAALGYVPKKLTHLFVHERVVGHIDGHGRNSAGLYGAVVQVRPSLPGITLQQLPLDLWQQGCAELEDLLPHDQFAVLQRSVLGAAKQRCEVTGLDCRSTALKVSPVWRLDYDRQVALLVRCMSVCGPVYAAERVLDPRSSAVDQHAAIQLMQEVNQWGEGDADMYVQHVNLLQAQLLEDGGSWRYDVGVLL
jgi:hypothetical protein